MTGYATVTYDIESGLKVKIAEINFIGVTAFNAKKTAQANRDEAD